MARASVEPEFCPQCGGAGQDHYEECPSYRAPADLSDPKHVKERKEQTKTRKILVEKGLEECLSTRQGRAFIWDMLEACGVFRTSFSVNSNQMSFAEGQRNVGLKLYAAVCAHPAEMSTMTSENSK